MKKFFLILVAIIGISISANAIVWRGTHKVCSEDGTELTLRPSGGITFWHEGQSSEGTYDIDNGYLNLYEKNGDRIGSFKYYFDKQTQKLIWVDINIRGMSQRLTNRNCK